MIEEPPDIVNTGPGAPNNFGGTCERLKPKKKAPVANGAADSLGVKVDENKPTQIKCSSAEMVGEGVSLKDFNAYMPAHSYIYTPSREMWPAASVNARIPPVSLLNKIGEPLLDKDGTQKTMAGATWLDKHSPVEQMTWAPGLPMLIPNRLVSE